MRASANLPVSHSMPPDSAMESLSPATRQPTFVISTANIHRKCINSNPQLNALIQGPVGRLLLSRTLQLFLARLVYSSPVGGPSNKALDFDFAMVGNWEVNFWFARHPSVIAFNLGMACFARTCHAGTFG